MNLKDYPDRNSTSQITITLSRIKTLITTVVSEANIPATSPPCEKLKNVVALKKTCWSSGNVLVSGARFKSRVDQIWHGVRKCQGLATATTCLKKTRSCVARVSNDMKMDPANSLHVSA